ncbi:N-acetylmuramoyl-L-alanine amidase family protein [Gracilibacillus thailandensis]|uniref:MurNAc-LAA domain-containing protein n=1 Tax=Gracilibacillus thailandensis TaxID=563735 RepID=A0A6N7R2M7_9BACI|nr:N-acetylmuramoyl-L-alanine amidase [Gracilibacillus thailandensis]MRI65376.1 hypothetical protein [Gracilibacillus thailandensis]
MVKIYIDPGHGGRDSGATGNGLREKDLNLAISLKIREKLNHYQGVTVRLSRIKDRTLSLRQRTNDCVVVNSLVGTKSVQKVAELTLPITAFAGLDVLDDLVAVDVVPNLDEVTQNARIIRDKVVNIGVLPVTITVTIAGVDLPVTLSTSIPFQEHTDFPGACPEDTLQETPLEVEGIFTQPGVPVITGPVVGDLVTGILFKVVLRTNITVTRPVIQDAQGNICDVNPNRCNNIGDAPSFTLPAPENANGGIIPLSNS